MRKQFCLFLFLFSNFFLGAFILTVRAQTGPAQEAQTWRCLTSTHTDQNDYTAYAEGTGFPIATDIYLVTCAGIGGCTTGNAEYDALLKLPAGASGAISADPPGKTRTTDGRVTLRVTDQTWFHTATLSFFGVILGTPIMPTPTGRPEMARGEEPSIQQGTLEFAIMQKILPQDIPKDCTVIGWDPFGRVFDAQSLEPIPGVTMTLYDKDKKKYTAPFTPNPQKVASDGAFNFLVEEGTYYLMPIPSKGYTFSETPAINQRYTIAYSNLYKPNAPIAELIDTDAERKNGKPDPEHRDIPLDPGTNKAYEACPSSVSYSVFSLGGYTKVSGKVSHPLTLVSLMQGEKELLKKQADKFGFYDLLVENTKIAQDTPLGVKFTKVDLTGAGRTFPECK